MPISARALALQTLIGVSDGRYGNLAVDAVLSRHPDLEPADRGLFTTLVYGTLERQTTLDFLISRLSDRPADRLDPAVLTAVRLGLYQLIWLDRVPDHAAINETVDLVPQKARGFVNAVLRAYLRFEASLGANAPRENALTAPADWAARFPVLADDPLRAASVCFGIPENLSRLFFDAFGSAGGTDKAVSVMSGFCRRPPLCLRVNTLKTTPERLTEALISAGASVAPGGYLPTALRLDGGSVTDLPGFASGDFFVQDEASQLCVRALDARPGMTVMDVCACPGSKSFGAAIDMAGQGTVRCYDLHESKLSLVRKGAERLGINDRERVVLTAEARDARKPDLALFGTADRVLCDVPCSGLGVIAKKPEIRHKDLSESARLPAIQREILEQSARYVREDGILVYSTCTWLPAENRDVVSDFLCCHPAFEPLDFRFDPRPGSPYRPIISEGGMATLTPDDCGTDGFFIARLRKVGT